MVLMVGMTGFTSANLSGKCVLIGNGNKSRSL
jgi:hypothetical protein